MSLKDKVPSNPLGFGTAPLGDMFRKIPEQEAADTIDAAWREGTRYFDTAPFYGAGLSEIRLGELLAKYPRDEYVLSTGWRGCKRWPSAMGCDQGGRAAVRPGQSGGRGGDPGRQPPRAGGRRPAGARRAVADRRQS
ncbi:hypothetical protein FVD38_07620 [Massilia arenae]|uniref:NADP-dependent oxidoreductase domain-containing protein n=1 Tax=Massilia arenae TaxID=2603288 RepID=A0A5C7G4G7_9BURK|nr:hypothetical protein FVD38_07620 [Massilia arenae]